VCEILSGLHSPKHLLEVKWIVGSYARAGRFFNYYANIPSPQYQDSMQWELIGSGAALLTMFGFMPQILKIYRTKSVEDVSLGMLLQFSLGVFLWLLYGMHLKDNILIVANTVSFLSLVVAIGLFLKYRRNRMI
jgi:MtN3 and saliva related transmembrane protein